MTTTTKLELTWIGKDVRPRLEPRILLEDPSLSHHADARTSDVDLFDNRLIFGDNLLALKALEQEFTGQVRCIYIDPPFNTGQAPNEFPNLTIRKIPNAVLGKCEFGHDDYSLEIANLPQQAPTPSPFQGEGWGEVSSGKRRRRGYAEAEVGSLFGDGNGGQQ
jgi:hypothetical protein